MADPSGDAPSAPVPQRLSESERVASIIPSLGPRSSDRGERAETDGRSRRRDRNRTAVIHAMLDLIREGDLSPATATIAERAGVSHRSVFRYFDDLGDLVREAINIELAAALEITKIHKIGLGSLDHRIGDFVSSRIRVYGHTYGVSRVARFRAGQIEEIDNALGEIALLQRAQVLRQFEPELAPMSETVAAATVDAILVMTDFTPYDLLRRMLGYEDDRVAKIWRHAIETLLS
jgi:AcrR family transcriptional regulator